MSQSSVKSSRELQCRSSVGMGSKPISKYIFSPFLLCKPVASLDCCVGHYATLVGTGGFSSKGRQILLEKQ